MKQDYIIGTRGSLLALTQCNLIKNDIEKKSNLTFTLNKIKTQGDQITDKPLWQLEGKDFFTKELDEKLIDREIDLVVHSYKDLGSIRPDDIELNCITERFYAHDILLIKKSTTANLKNLNSLNVGTSSPRRIHNITKSLKENIPTKDIEISCSTLRGNVNTRIEKLLDGKYDAIVLALAGLERLASSKDSRIILEKLLADLDFMVLPQKSFPSSASQGALAIETHKNAPKELIEALKNVHHENSAQEIKRERKSFNDYGGGCHLAVGVHVKKINNLFIHIHKGSLDSDEIDLLELEGFDYSKITKKEIYNVIGENDFLIERIPTNNIKTSADNLFITSKHCLHAIHKFNSIWTSGASTRKKVLEMGIWVNGCADGFGHNEIKQLKASKTIQILLKNNNWKVLSHNKGFSDIGETLGVYTHQIKNINGNKKEKIEKAHIIYWNSFTQYSHYIKTYPELKNKIHACGLGKTLEQFLEQNINVIPALSFEYLQKKVNPHE